MREHQRGEIYKNLFDLFFTIMRVLELICKKKGLGGGDVSIINILFIKSHFYQFLPE